MLLECIPHHHLTLGEGNTLVLPSHRTNLSLLFSDKQCVFLLNKNNVEKTGEHTFFCCKSKFSLFIICQFLEDQRVIWVKHFQLNSFFWACLYHPVDQFMCSDYYSVQCVLVMEASFLTLSQVKCDWRTLPYTHYQQRQAL